MADDKEREFGSALVQLAERVHTASCVASIDDREVKLLIVCKPDGSYEITEVEDV